MTEGQPDLVVGEDGRARCSWGAGPDPLYRDYHDHEWGRPSTDDTRLFEKLCLEGFQAGLAWITILRKRESFRSGFAGFDAPTVAAFGPDDVERLVADAGIVRHRGKITSTINNAARLAELQTECGSLAAYAWSFEPTDAHAFGAGSEIPALTSESTAMSKDLRKRGWSFVGPTTVYAFMQAMGVVDDHLIGCWARDRCEVERSALARPAR